jgi:hypothetical protein
MSDEPKKAASPLRLALGMIVGATAFYVFLAPHDWREHLPELDHCITDWQLFYPLIGGLIGLAIEVASHLKGRSFGITTRSIAGGMLIVIVACRVSEPGIPPPSSMAAAGLPMPKSLLCFDDLAHEDFRRRLSLPHIAIWGGTAGCLLISGLLIHRHRSGRIIEPKPPQ